MSEMNLRLWSDEDFLLLERLMGDPAMMTYLGGAESPENIRGRHQKYCALAHSGSDRMFVIEIGADLSSAGSIGYWEKEWRGGTVWETGWSVLPDFQGQGVATRATLQIIEMLKENAIHRYLHAFPSTDNLASNAICRKAGFTLLETMEFEYPPGNLLQCNDWQFDLLSNA